MQVNRRMGLVAKLASTLVVALAAAAAGSSWAQPTQLRPPASALGSAPKPIGMGTAAGNSMHNIPPAVLVPQAPQEKKDNTPSRESKINEFNENAHKNDALYSAYKPTPSFVIPDEFKARYKYIKAWIDGDVLHVATDAKMKLTVAQVLVPNQQYTKVLASISKDYYNAPVFSEKIQLSELRSKMEGGTSGYYQFNFGTSDNLSVSINFDKNFIVQSTNPAPVAKGPKLVSVEFAFTTGAHDKEAGKPIYIFVFSKTHDKIYNATGQYEPKTKIVEYRIEDPAKWDEGNKQVLDIKVANTYLSDFSEGGYVLVYGAKGDIWQFTVNVKFKFADNTTKLIHWATTFSGNNYPGFNFDKEFKMKEKFTK
ncbi:MAG: hypothetical protein IPQ22_08640 [Rhodoferax sp.]|nr:hypothetical protein [Rhodoferax sp.]